MIILRKKKPNPNLSLEESARRLEETARLEGRVIERSDAWLNEMSIQAISSRKDGLPFRITTKSPDHAPPHAHIMDLATGKKEQGQFLVSKNPPRSPKDIENYKQGVTDDMRKAIFEWSKLPWKKSPDISNWQALYYSCLNNEKW
jgi:hypothetical protein